MRRDRRRLHRAARDETVDGPEVAARFERPDGPARLMSVLGMGARWTVEVDGRPNEVLVRVERSSSRPVEGAFRIAPAE